ncbi:hypothetical protein PVAND_003335 [Polypedilum vanderplanki]|uniref:Uncharacterized protein n=1 Tax=Polypedilum vanderplanki TaxID=319348 RepID=A0A9J6BUT2_POLVA|nr:hypothetical protein PVAND_003335 [Polypedilum vanderplanki]
MERFVHRQRKIVLVFVIRKDKKKFDPSIIPVGQDFMGDSPCTACPFVQKSPEEFHKEAIEKCPFFQQQKSNKPVQMIDYEENAKHDTTEKKSLIARHERD